MGKAAAQKKLIENMADVFRKVQKEYGLPFGEIAAPVISNQRRISHNQRSHALEC
jgi:hypothetical protein